MECSGCGREFCGLHGRLASPGAVALCTTCLAAQAPQSMDESGPAPTAGLWRSRHSTAFGGTHAERDEFTDEDLRSMERATGDTAEERDASRFES